MVLAPMETLAAPTHAHDFDNSLPAPISEAALPP